MQKLAQHGNAKAWHVPGHYGHCIQNAIIPKVSSCEGGVSSSPLHTILTGVYFFWNDAVHEAEVSIVGIFVSILFHYPAEDYAFPYCRSVKTILYQGMILNRVTVQTHGLVHLAF